MQNMYRIPFERFERYSPYGTPAEIAEFLAAYVRAGCTRFNVMPVAESPEREVDAVAEIRERLRAAA
jgi:alkanesulfonate monooxygenase SsuD/methylene tetrahydromethanopterin reductase-like flavin-dependent oxidoreductase (luciferase family)